MSAGGRGKPVCGARGLLSTRRSNFGLTGAVCRTFAPAPCLGSTGGLTTTIGSLRTMASGAGRRGRSRRCRSSRATRRQRRALAVATWRPDEIVGASRWRRHRLALDQNAVGSDVGVHRLAAAAAQEFLGISRRHGQGHNRSCHRADIRFRIGHRGDRSCGERHRHFVAHVAADFPLDVVGELARARLGEIDAVARAQPPHLAFIIRAEVRVLAGFVDKAVPDVDVVHPSALGARAKKIVEVAGVGGGLGAADRRQADPEHRHAFALEGGDRLVDALGIDLGPFVAAEFDDAVGDLAALRLGHIDPALVLIVGLIFIFLVGVFAVLLVLGVFGVFGVLFRFFGKVALADVLPVANAEHHNHVVGFVLRQQIARDMPPVEIALGLVAQQPGIDLVLAHDADFRRIRERVLQAISEPVGHAVAHDHDRGRRRRRVRIRFVRRWRARRFKLGLRLRLLKLARIRARIVAAAAEPAEKSTLLLTLALERVAVVGALGMSRLGEREIDGGDAGALRHGQNDRPDEPA